MTLLPDPTHPDSGLLAATAAHVRATMLGDGSHDWWHVHRVWRNARAIAAGELQDGRTADRLVVELAALLHDIADWKFHGGDDSAGPNAARTWLECQSVEASVVDHVADIVGRVSFKGAGVPDDMLTLEGRIVQDADRLDAIGAVGIARTFAYGGHAGRPIHDPDEVAELHDDPEAYKSRPGGASITHFHEKLLHLHERMHTPSARRIAAARHAYMETFLTQFQREWAGEA
jgi:uncharacterized protein